MVAGTFSQDSTSCHAQQPHTIPKAQLPHTILKTGWSDLRSSLPCKKIPMATKRKGEEIFFRVLGWLATNLAAMVSELDNLWQVKLI